MTKKKSLLHFQITQLLQKGESIPSKLKNQYTTVKKKTKNECRRALNMWWEEKTKEAKISMKLGKGGSLLKTLKLIGKSRHNQHPLFINSDGSTKIVTTTQKLQRWHEHFMNLINVDTEIDDDAYDILPKSNIQYDLD